LAAPARHRARSSCFDPQTGQLTNEKQLALYLRYQKQPIAGPFKVPERSSKAQSQTQKLRLASNSTGAKKRSTPGNS